MLDILIAHPWLLAILWAGMYVFDYASTLWLRRVYGTTLSKYVVFERGVELNPNWEKEIAAGRSFSLKFVLLLTLVVALILLSAWTWPLLTEFLAGALLLTWSFINLRHIRNYMYVWFLRQKPEALGGRHEQSYWFMQKQLSGEAAAWALLYLFLAILTVRLFFLAGTVTCLSLALRAYRLANRKFKSTPAREGTPTT